MKRSLQILLDLIKVLLRSHSRIIPVVPELDRTHYVLGVLTLAEDLGVRVSATRLQKVTFLVVKEYGLDLG